MGILKSNCKGQLKTEYEITSFKRKLKNISTYKFKDILRSKLKGYLQPIFKEQPKLEV